MSQVSFVKPTLLLVEGPEDKVFFTALAEHVGIASNIQIEHHKGKTLLKDELGAVVRTPGFHAVVRLGIIRDADDNPKGAFQSVCGALAANGLAVPKNPFEPAGDKPQVSVAILPDGNTPGMLEDVCLMSVVDDPALPCVEAYFECLEKSAQMRSSNIAKAKVRVFLASRKRPDLRLGEAAKAGYWPWGNDKAFKKVKDFIKTLAQ